ncbi:hypothetical protein CSE45_5388 [Citreicella sp. SE45]|uniref:Uncharacterized protein n=1 Tax=Salipiger thiooxidans TaxID=282683 RepID=A0A1G7N411_9RHOB|nr:MULTISPECIES: hypothetical protein [Salipiger]EEX11922.1 hypothetical protein CSE45_5388 [Citreicella sp. SE45]NIY96086.1 hypothetical protein [Salipiger sp. HF18]NVK59857.1 hypothetical protein [Paracoccaceae bacterium]SDF68815.1 hypothetical protein SAMN04488105_1516 [Salipiger thiooxidans]
MEAPFDVTSWDGITGAIYAGYGSVEGLWIAVCLALIVVAIVFGWRHEEHAYKATRKR